MEKAIFITNIQYFPNASGDYTRLYFGIEFCERLLPSVQELVQALDFSEKHKLAFTFVTPFVTDVGIEKLEELMAVLIARGTEVEIVVNDFGFLHVLKQKKWKGAIALGRLLTKQKRGPQIMNVVSQLPPEAFEHFKQSNVDSPITAEFLSECGVSRVELDNLLQGISRPQPLLRGSLYIPYAYVTTTRFCLSAGCEKSRASSAIRSVRPCEKECQKYEFELSHKSMPVKLLLKGNTQFFVNNSLPDNLEALNIDRLVFQPIIPI